MLVEPDPFRLVSLVGIARGLDGKLRHLARKAETFADLFVTKPAEIEHVSGTLAKRDAPHKVGGGVERFHRRLELGGGFDVGQELDSSDQFHALVIAEFPLLFKRRLKSESASSTATEVAWVPRAKAPKIAEHAIRPTSIAPNWRRLWLEIATLGKYMKG